MCVHTCVYMKSEESSFYLLDIMVSNSRNSLHYIRLPGKINITDFRESKVISNIIKTKIKCAPKNSNIGTLSLEPKYLFR